MALDLSGSLAYFVVDKDFHGRNNLLILLFNHCWMFLLPSSQTSPNYIFLTFVTNNYLFIAPFQQSAYPRHSWEFLACECEPFHAVSDTGTCSLILFNGRHICSIHTYIFVHLPVWNWSPTACSVHIYSHGQYILCSCKTCNAIVQSWHWLNSEVWLWGGVCVNIIMH